MYVCVCVVCVCVLCVCVCVCVLLSGLLLVEVYTYFLLYGVVLPLTALVITLSEPGAGLLHISVM